jgi:hypothetical protein
MLLFACASEPQESAVLSEPTLQFRFAVFADPHISGSEDDHVERLQAAVDWVNENTEDLDLRLVLVVGDVGWGAEGLPQAKTTLDTLSIPYIPITGDNEVQFGSEETYATTFETHYTALSEDFPDFRVPDGAVENPEIGGLSWFSNMAFSYEGLHFIGLDWASRVDDPILGETGYLHDFAGGTLPFLKEELATVTEKREQVILFSHIPMHFSPGGFSTERNATVEAILKEYEASVWADLAGHYHISAEEEEAAGYMLYVTDAIWDDTIDIRIIDVFENEAGFSYISSLVVAD